MRITSQLITFTAMIMIHISMLGNDIGGWYMYFGNTALPESSFKVHHELQYRNHQFVQDMDQLLLRIGAQYQWKDVGTVTLGYGHIITEDAGELNNTRKENRIYQEFLLPQTVKQVNIKHRFRYEQRFFDHNRINTRYRYSIGLDFPIYKFNTVNNLYANAYNEVFIHGRKRPSTDDLFDRNRLYMGIGYKLNNSIAIQVGYMQQMFIEQSHSKFMLSLHHQLTL